MNRFFAPIAALLLTTCPVAAQDKLTVMPDWFVNPGHGPIVPAAELGYFTDVGLEVELVSPADPNDSPRMGAAGRMGIAVSYQPEYLNRRRGQALRRVSALIETPLNCLVVLADGPVQSIKDLAGRKVGFLVAGVEEMLLDAMLAHHDMAPDAVEQINIGWSIPPALMAGQVDDVIGAFCNFELNQVALEDPEGRCFTPEPEGVPSYDELIYVADPERMNPALIARFLGATERAGTFILNDPEEAWKFFAATDRELQAELNARVWGDTWPRFALRPAAFDAGRYIRLEEFHVAQGVTDAQLDISELAIDVTGGKQDE